MVPIDRDIYSFFGEASIELFPTTGNTTQEGEPIVMSGSILRGTINLTTHHASYCHSLSLIFHGSESLPLRAIGSSITQPKHQQFFGTRRVLMTSQELSPGTRQIPFAFQLPKVQYPPSMEHNKTKYSCRFLLTFTIGPEQVLATKQVRYKPLIETRLLHTPYVKTFRVAKRSVNHGNNEFSAKIHALDYLPGDTIFLGLKPHGDNSSSLSPESAATGELLLQVVQIATILNQYDTKLQPVVTEVASSNQIIPSNSSTNASESTRAASTPTEEDVPSYHYIPTPFSSSYSYNNEGYTNTLSISIPSWVPPSFSYGRIITISYRLRLVLPSHKKTLWSVISGSDLILFDIPISIGTVSYDAHAAMQHLQVYSVYSTLFNDPTSRENPHLSSLPNLPVPVFIPITSTRFHYHSNYQRRQSNNSSGGESDTDTLPPYNSLRLPDYEETANNYLLPSSNLEHDSNELQQLQRSSSNNDNNTNQPYQDVHQYYEESSPSPSDTSRA